MRWTEKQLDVINTRGRNILVSAAAGSGKTAVLVERIIKMITDQKEPVDIDRLLVVTFTRAAALEMKERVREALEKKAEECPEDINLQKQLSFIHNAHISTIDSFCASVVRDNFDKIDLDPNFRIADETEIEMLKADIIEEMLEEYYEEATPEFMELAQQYSAGKLSDNIEALISKLYRDASGHYNPKKWIENCIHNYNVSSIDEFENSVWMQEFLDSVRKEMEGWIDSLNLAMSISESEDGPKYGKGLRQLMDMIDEMKSLSSFDAMRDAVLNAGTIRLSGVRNCDENKKKQVSDIKTAVTKGIHELKTSVFRQSIQDLFEDMVYSKSSVEMIIKLTLDFMERFQTQKSEKGIMDFNDQAHFALNILVDEDEDGYTHPSDVAKQLSLQFREIMIDEYQDSNYVQEAILSSISGGYGKNNMFMVGDVKQSIYRFRQAEPKLFLSKYDSYLEDLNADNCKIILDKNFRSRKEVIDSVNYIFDYIMHREVGGIDYKNGNRLSLGADYEELPRGQNNATELIMIEGEDKKTEAEYVAQKIREITNPVNGMKITEKGQNMRPVRYGDIAILLRSMKGNSDIYLEHMENNGIPAYAESRTGYYQTMEVQTIINALSVIDNPRQDIPLAAIMVSPMFGFSSEELACIKAENVCECLYDNVKAYEINGSDERLAGKVRRFLNLLNQFRNMVPYTSVYAIINKLLAETGYDYYIMAMANGKKRHLNIEALKEKAAAYDETSYKGLFNFTRYVEKLQYLSKDEGEASAVSENDNIVHIMSVHKSKGLQFPVVFLCNTNGKSRTDHDMIVADDKGNIGVDYIDSRLKIKEPTVIKKAIKQKNKEADIFESLRILYVALTRAKEKLFITGVAKDIDKLAGEFANRKYDKSEYMSYNDIIGGKNFMDWIGNTVGKNKAFDDVTGDYEFEPNQKNDMYDRDCSIVVKKVYHDEIMIQELQGEITDEIKRETLGQLETVSITDEKIKSIVEKNFQFRYPFMEEVAMHSKASVTEIKKQSMEYVQEQDGFAVYGEKPQTDLQEIIPDFAKSKEQLEAGFSGAWRGTAYHRVFELLDMEKENYTEKSIKEMIESFVKIGMIDRESADVVNVLDVVCFTKSKLFSRMKQAYKTGQLFRERKFLMGVPVKQIKEKSDSAETMIIQGIIDVCFMEEDKFVIVDYKTDRVDTMEELVRKYHVQLACYKQAIEQISGKTVSEMIIYSVCLGDEISL